MLNKIIGRKVLLPAQRERISETVKLMPGDIDTILDVGCGNGSFLNNLASKYQTVGIDSSGEALKYVKRKAILADISKIPFRDKTFDLVTCLEVLEHLSNNSYLDAISEIERVAKKYIIVSVPNNENLVLSLVRCPACRCRFHPYYHTQSFSSGVLRGLFSNFDPLVIKEIGLRRVDTYPQAISMAYSILSNQKLPENAVCPQCGYKEPAWNPENNKIKGRLLHHLLMPLRLTAKSIWRQRNKNEWLISLYNRR